jgi:hypothetical protein
MRLTTVLFIAVLIGVSVPPISVSGSRASHQTAIITFARPTWVAQRLLVGTYVIVHDDDRMAQGEPCTALYRVRGGSDPLEEVVSFHCIPKQRSVPQSFTTTVERSPSPDGIDILTEYQFEGDPEAHGVPVTTSVSYTTSIGRCWRKQWTDGREL